MLDLTEQLTQKDLLVQALTLRVDEKEQTAKTLLAQVNEKKRIARSLSAQVDEKEHAVQTFSGLVAEKELSVQSLKNQLAERNFQLSEIRGSKAWRAGLLLRRFRQLFIPPNSFRSKVVRRLLDILLIPLHGIFQKYNTANDLALIRASNLFDVTWYLTNNPDIALANIDPALHYLRHGGFEGRNPSPNFSSSYYLSTYSDVKKSGINPLIHFIKFGKNEGRFCIPGNIPVERKIIKDNTFKPKITIIVPNYNHSIYLEKRLSSIYHQSYNNYEVILLDDFSSDQSKKILLKYQKQYPEKTRCLFNEENSGSAFSQWKKGIENAKGELVWIAESDDYCDLNFLEMLVPLFADETILLSYAHSIFVDEKDHKHIFAFEHYLSDINKGKWDTSYISSAHNEVNSSLGLKNTIPNVSSVIFRRPKGNTAILNDPNWLNMKVCGDWLFYLNFIRGGRIAYCNETNNYYRIHQASTSKETHIKDIYYKEHETVACAIASLYDVPDELLLKNHQLLEKFYLQTVKKSDIYHFNQLFSLEKILKYKRKRIPNILIGVYAFSFGGGEVFPIRLANSLKEKGTSVIIFNGNNEPIHPKVREMINPEIPVINYDRTMDLNALVNEFGIEITHTHHASMDRLFSSVNNSKHLVTMHGMYEMMEDFRYNTRDYVDKIDHWFYTTDKNITPFKINNIYDARKFSKVRNGMMIPEIHHISLDQFGITRNSFTVCLATRALPTKGWMEAIESITIARETTNKDIHLLLIGEGPLYEFLKNKTIPNYIHLLGYKSNLVDYFAVSQLGFLPTYFKGESFPLVIIECFMAGKPIIASNIGEIPDMIMTDDHRIGGALINLHKGKVRIDELASALIKMVEDEKYYKNCVNSVNEIKMKFDLNKIAESYLESYMQLVSNPYIRQE
jgi:glycosyltransferase involved in cell wall biosynthesis